MVAGLSAAELADTATRLLGDDPARASAVAARALAQTGDDPAVASRAGRALGMAALELSDTETAVAHLRRAVAVARRAGLDDRAGEARMSLALALLYRGDSAPALRQADRALAEAGSSATGLMEVQRGLILERLGRYDQALRGYARAEARFRRAGDAHGEARLRCNRGVLRTYRGDFRGARADLEAAERLSSELGQTLMVATVRNNLGFLATREGDLPAALDHFEAAAGELQSAGGARLANLEMDRCETLLAAGLPAEARRSAERAVAGHEQAGMAAEAAEARLLWAQAALQERDPATAQEQAARALRAFTAQRRRPWATLARHVAVRAAWDRGERGPALLARARSAALELEAQGWRVAALDALLLAARIALADGRSRSAQSLLSAAAAARRGPAALRVRAWHAEALLREQRGDLRGAGAALRAGLRVVETHRASLGATELRVHAGAGGRALAADGLRLALASGRPDRVLAWAERGRAGAISQPAVRPPADPELAELLAELRTVAAELDDAAKDGRDTAPARRRGAQLEGAIRRRARLARAARPGAARDQPTAPTLPDALGDAALVEIVGNGGALAAVVVAGTRSTLRPLAPAGEVAAELRALRFALRRLALPGGAEAMRAAQRGAAAHAAAELDRMLLHPLTDLIAERPLVMVPTGPLHGVPWALLASCVARPVAIAPSAAVWLRAAAAPSLDAGALTVAIAGPGLEHAAAEAAAVAACHAGAGVLSGDRASVTQTQAALERADRVHLACHGSFRSDNALFSSLRLADGPLTVYDVEQLERVPRQIVLSACDSGVSSVHAGDELMGLASTLLARGTATLLASVVPVPDAAAPGLMLAVHRALARGTRPAQALAQAAQTGGDDDAELVASAAFVCFGAL